MDFKIFRFTLRHTAVGDKEGLLLQDGKRWSEVSPLPGRSQETISEALQQLKSVQQGYAGSLFPSVAFGLFGLTAPRIVKAPVCLFLMGTPQEILKHAKKNHGCKAAKIKLGAFDLPTAIFLVKTLKKEFRLRIDIGSLWDHEKIKTFCSEFDPHDFEFIEDPGHDVSPFEMASDDAGLGSKIVWKPMIRGLPPKQAPVILSSSYESGIGLHHIAALAASLEIPAHPLGIGTFINMEEDLLETPLEIREGEVYFPAEFQIKKERLSPC
jgi:O-succinylbenzoate synthase